MKFNFKKLKYIDIFLLRETRKLVKNIILKQLIKNIKK